MSPSGSGLAGFFKQGVMKASELRIGNYILDHLGNVCTVELIERHGGIHVSSLKYSLGDGMNNISEGFNPIPITEDWMAGFGMTKDNGRYGLGDYGVLSLYNDKPIIHITLYGPNDIYDGEAPCEYVHQLQNLYHALTGNELEMK